MMQRISVVGTSGAGKTHLAQQLADILNIPHIELDALHWKPNWQATPREELREAVTPRLTEPAWVVDGNYSSSVMDMVWQNADMVIWLDYSFWRVLWRVTRRSVVRGLRREELWNGNRESLRKLFSKKDSMIWWVITTYRRRRRQMQELLQNPENNHLKVIRFRSPAQADYWLRNLAVR
jgi:adenylate kinase family enzyme